MTKDQLINLLEVTLQAIKDDDSFQGSIQYDAIEAPEGEDFFVGAVIRIGNSMGQGGMILVQEGEGDF